MDLSVSGLIVAAPSREPGIEFVSRFFATKNCVDEDPVTGSARCTPDPGLPQKIWTDCIPRVHRMVSPVRLLPGTPLLGVWFGSYSQCFCG